jgi:sugar phosphate isomerase/epimerase
MVTVRAEEAIPMLAGIGYDCIELAVVPGWRDGVNLLTPARRRRIKQLLGEYEMPLVAVAANTDLLADDPDEFAENWRNLTDTVDLAVEWAGREGPPAVDTAVRLCGGARGPDRTPAPYGRRAEHPG